VSAVLWLRLHITQGLGAVRAARLLERFDEVEKIFAADVVEIANVAGVSVEVAKRLLSDETQERAQRMLEEANECGAQVIYPTHRFWPPQFVALSDAPVVLFVRGSGEVLSRRQVAVVGTRRAGSYGRSVARRLSASVASAGFAVTSGLAEGIDTAAHKGALEAGGATIAVMATGPDNVYPPENRRLAEKIVACGGALVTEFPPRSSPRRQNFPFRNRIIAALCEALVVVEAPQRSGALITANYAADMGRTVMVVPGRIDDPNFVGSHRLIQQGAALVASVSDVLQELGAPPKEVVSRVPRLPPDEAVVYEALSGGAETVEEIARQSGLPPPRVLSALVRLQMRRLVSYGVGGRWSRIV